MFQLKNASAFRATCGTAPVGIYGVENLDISHLVSTHSNYCTMAHSALRAVGFGEPRMLNAEYDRRIWSRAVEEEYSNTGTNVDEST